MRYGKLQETKSNKAYNYKNYTYENEVAMNLHKEEMFLKGWQINDISEKELYIHFIKSKK